MTRWTVKRHRGWSGDLRPGWLVFGDPEWACGKWFPTWREALDYADRRARTVEAVLPREHIFTIRGSRHIFITSDGQTRQETLITGNGMYTTIDRSQVLPLALALLAHHHRTRTPQPTQP